MIVTSAVSSVISRAASDVAMRALSVFVLIACNSSSSPPTATGSAVAPKPAPRTSEVHVDRRIELMSIVMRLAKAEEYTQAPPAPYVVDVDRVFAPFADHPAVRSMKRLRESNGIAFDAPMHLAIHLDDKLEPRAVDDLVANDERWKGVDLAAFARELRDFAQAAKLDAFLAAHADTIKRVEQAFRAPLDAEHPVEG